VIVKPNFFIVGAPKAGTTSMDYYLGQHPEIFIPFTKELHFFGSDLEKRPNNFSILDEAKYLNLFKKAGKFKCRGESSVMYLSSKMAAKEIKAFSPDAKIIILLRHPVEMMYAQHSQLLWAGYEDIPSFPDALAAEKHRTKGLHIPKSNFIHNALFYMELAQYSSQVERYFSRFGRKNVFVRLFDDLRDNTLATYRETLSFLGVEDSYIPVLNVLNKNKTSRIPQLMFFLQNPPRTAGKILKRMPDKIRIRMLQGLFRLNTKYEDRKPMDFELRQRLTHDLTEEIEKLGRLINRDLSAWTSPDRLDLLSQSRGPGCLQEKPTEKVIDDV
jgi:Sulfotransferase family